MRLQFFIGWDPREVVAFTVARATVRRYAPAGTIVRGLLLEDLTNQGLYSRPFEWRRSAVDKPVMWDVISDAPQSTEHACARFLAKELGRHLGGWAIFVDGDVMARGDLQELAGSLDDRYAVMCVKHNFAPPEGFKMDGQMQQRYARKNWSSVMAFNCDHPSNERLTVRMINGVPGRDLHRFCWLEDGEIGELHPKFNYLVGHTDKSVDPVIVHFTEGVPDMAGYENVEYSDEWRREVYAMVRETDYAA